jgi:hypothetical protein
MLYINFSFKQFCIPNFLMPPKTRKKAQAERPVGRHKTISEVISDSGEEFEHLSIEAEEDR